MNVSTIAVPKELAIEKLNEYKSVLKQQRRPEDLALQRAFRAARKYRLIDVSMAFKETGLNELGQPKLAIAQADWVNVYFQRRTFRQYRGSWESRKRADYIHIPEDCLNTSIGVGRVAQIMSPVPHIPPGLRPKYKLSNYHILFEVEKWQEYPVDPFLLKRVHGWIFAIIAEWDLTPLEQRILSGF